MDIKSWWYFNKIYIFYSTGFLIKVIKSETIAVLVLILHIKVKQVNLIGIVPKYKNKRKLYKQYAMACMHDPMYTVVKKSFFSDEY